MTDLQTLFSQWKAAEARAEDPALTEDEMHKACDAANAIVAQMLHVPAVSAADMALKLIAFTADGAFESGPESGPGSDLLWIEIRKLAGAA